MQLKKYDILTFGRFGCMAVVDDPNASMANGQTCNTED